MLKALHACLRCGQVKDCTGAWIDVKLAPDEIAVFMGHTAERATAGLLKAGVFRTVRMHTCQFSLCTPTS